MLILINGDCLLNPEEIAEVQPKRSENPGFVPNIKTPSIEVQGNDQEPYLEVTQVTFKNGHQRIIEIKFDEFCAELQKRIKDAAK